MAVATAGGSRGWYEEGGGVAGVGVQVGVGQLEYLSINFKCCTQHTNRN